MKNSAVYCALCIVVITLLCFSSSVTGEVPSSASVNVTDGYEFAAALDNLAVVSGGGNTWTLTLQDNIALSKNIFLQSGTYTLTGNGFTITRQYNLPGILFVVGPDAGLILGDGVSSLIIDGNAPSSESKTVALSTDNSSDIRNTDNPHVVGRKDGLIDSSSILLISGSMEMKENVVLRNNAGGAVGGAIYVFGGNFTMSGGEISENSANCGGGIYVSSPDISLSMCTISGGSICKNIALSGGAVYVDGISLLKLSDNGTISENIADCGGGIFVESGLAEISGGFVRNNTALKGAGAGNGVYVFWDGSFWLRDHVSIADTDDIRLNSKENRVHVAAPLTSDSVIVITPAGTFQEYVPGSVIVAVEYQGGTGMDVLQLFRVKDFSWGLEAFETYLKAVSLTPEPVMIHSASELAAAVGGSVQDSVVTLTRDQVLTNPIHIVDGVYTLRGNGHTLSRSPALFGEMISVYSGVNLTLGDGSTSLIIDGSRIRDAGSILNISGTVSMFPHVVLRNNTAHSDGAGVFLGPNSRFIMLGGEISENEMTAEASGGGGVYVSPNATFEMKDGSISHNVVSKYSSAGGGVYLDSSGNAAGRFVMSGGNISSNRAQRSSQGIFTSGEFIISGSAAIDANNDLCIGGNADSLQPIIVTGELSSPFVAGITRPLSMYYSGLKLIFVDNSSYSGGTGASVAGKFTLFDGGKFGLGPTGQYLVVTSTTQDAVPTTAKTPFPGGIVVILLILSVLILLYERKQV